MVSLEEAKKAVGEALNCGRLALLIGRCRVFYEGRAASKLSEGDRLLVIKQDGTFLVHQATKMHAINYQGPGSRISVRIDEGENALVVSSQRTKPLLERIDVKFFEVHFADSFHLRDDEKLKLFGSDRELSELLMQDLHLIEPGLFPLKQESDIRKGTIDILAEDFRHRLVVIEVKRREAGLDAVTQLARYVDEVSKRKDKATRGIMCAPTITPNALRMLERQGFEFFRLDYEVSNPSAKIKGLQKKQK
ncbi:endonuclease NucS, partial [Candidatus Micrarchaeota archaeon]|nr:endonuclease NucS [Candidatus Micrarchaeota archaeon]